MFQKYFVKLTSEERVYLEKLVSSGEASARKLRRARILLDVRIKLKRLYPIISAEDHAS